MTLTKNTAKLSKLDRLNIKMKSRPYIKGVSGPLHLSFLEKYYGASDARNSQICAADDQIITPYVLRMMECLTSYVNKTYAYADLELSDLFKETSTLNTEIENIRNRTETKIEATGEEALRQEEAARLQRQNDSDRIDEIKIRTALLKECFAIADESLNHHIGNADKITRTHISEYWRGVLKVNAGNIELPAYPVINEPECDGILAYKDHMSSISAMIDNILSEEKEEQQ